MPVTISCGALIGKRRGAVSVYGPKFALPHLFTPFSKRVKGRYDQPLASAEPGAALGHE